MTNKQQSPAKIAVADDDEHLRRLLVMLLEDLGYRVVCAAGTGLELLDQCSQQNVDVALVDLDMPEMDGLAAAEEIAHRGIPVVLISGHPDVEHVVLEHEPIAARITKPASVETLQAAIQQALSQR